MMESAKKPRRTLDESPIRVGVGGQRLNGSLLNGYQQRESIKNEELSQLEKEIKKAYMLKDLHAQVAEKEADRLSADIQARIREEIERCLSEAQNAERDKAERSARQQRNEELKEVLKRQVDEKLEQRSLLEEEERRERQLLVEVDRLREEKEERDKARRKELLAEQLFMEGLVQKEIREIDKDKLQELEAEEEVKNQQYLAELEERAEALKKKRAEAKERREEMIAKVARVLTEMENERSERKRLLADIVVEEVKFEAEIEAREAELRRRQKMREYAESLAEQIRFEQECRRRFLEREKEFAEAVLAKVMESEKMSRLSAEVRRRRRLEYRAELERLMEERLRAREQELERMQLALEEERLKEQEAREEARKARMLLLEQHIDKIADFMSRKSLYEEERGLLLERSNKK